MSLYFACPLAWPMSTSPLSPWHVPVARPNVTSPYRDPSYSTVSRPTSYPRRLQPNRHRTNNTITTLSRPGPRVEEAHPNPPRTPRLPIPLKQLPPRRRQPRRRRRWQLQSGTDDSDGTGSARTAGPDTANPAAHGGGPRLSGSEGEPGPAGREKETRRASQARWAGPYRPLARWPERPGRPGSSWPGLGRAGPGRPGGPAGQRGCGGGALEVYLPGFFRKYRSTASCARPPHLPTHPPTYPHTRHHVPRPGFPPSSVSLFARAASSPRLAGRKTMLPALTFFCPR